MPARLSTREPGFAAAFAQLVAANREVAADVDAAVAAIIEDVARRGDAALVDYTRRFDRIELAADGLRLSPREIAEGAAAAPAETVAACSLPPSGSRAFTAVNCRPRSIMSMRWGCASPPAGARSPPPGSMCRAAPLPIPPRC